MCIRDRVVTERVFDMIMLLLLTLVVVVSQFKQVGIFLNNNEEIKQKLYTMFHSPWTYVVLGVLIVGVAGFFWFVRKGTFFTRLHRFLSGMKEGLLTVKNVKQMCIRDRNIPRRSSDSWSRN